MAAAVERFALSVSRMAAVGCRASFTGRRGIYRARCRRAAAAIAALAWVYLIELRVSAASEAGWRRPAAPCLPDRG